MIKLSLKAAGALLNGSEPTQEVVFNGISTDTRTLALGNLFIPIRGEQFDGHDFIDEAIKKGASATLVHKKMDLPIPYIQVNDTLAAFGKISEYWRDQFSLPIIGVTGSNGKTTLKNMIASILRAACDNNAEQVLATEGNLNNNIGVPIMLSRLNKNHRYAVLEMGMNHFGEIEYLTKIVKPQVAVINNAAESHLEGLKDVAGVAKAKGEIFLGLEKNGTAILNRDDAHFDYWRGLVKQKIISFGLDPSADVTAVISEKQTTIKTPKGNFDVTLPLLGNHNVKNALAATAATLAIGIDLESIKAGLEQVKPAHGRMEQYTLSNGARLIDDTYNANPFSLQAAVNTLATFQGKKIVVLADMKELGDNSQNMHVSAGKKMRELGIDYLFTFGELSAATTEAFGNNAQHFTDRDQLIAALQPHLTTGVTVLVKGSRSMKMEKIVTKLIPETEHVH